MEYKQYVDGKSKVLVQTINKNKQLHFIPLR